MKKIDSLGLKMSSYQASLFEQSLKDMKCSSKIFIRRFMNSELAARMDHAGFLFDSTTVVDAVNELNEQYGESDYGKEKFTVEEMHWIGYIYRYWAYISGKSSKQLYHQIKPEQLRKLYYPYHSLDPLQAIERMTEETEPEAEQGLDDIARGVLVLRKVRNKRE